MTAEKIIEKLSLQPHPEGGWYRETWRSDVTIDGKANSRASATAIHFLLEADQFSEWHRVDATEIWLWHSGDPLILSIKSDWKETPQDHLLGGDILLNQKPQILVPSTHWQAARPVSTGEVGYSVVSCIVSPGFKFAGFEMRKS
ncbi:MAG: cupin domain-containing protein [Parasphingorhabdus sp.]